MLNPHTYLPLTNLISLYERPAPREYDAFVADMEKSGRKSVRECDWSGRIILLIAAVGFSERVRVGGKGIREGSLFRRRGSIYRLRHRE